MKEVAQPITNKVVIDTGIFDRELLERACREIKANKEKLNSKKSAK
ncbi:hypothetical protein [Paenibacillus xylanilyticus]|uniref:Uncharacterized protein n=1 Tax=Paenibacillus xylanilyticus TaxID=248903 RepID=A0A7Y6BS76_9BACL|nr:hypothetical protein [Paenibacillus xylanilyticus]NUU73979.1 hypothetical protein [Paenibacillus xylanilyticus]